MIFRRYDDAYTIVSAALQLRPVEHIMSSADHDDPPNMSYKLPYTSVGASSVRILNIAAAENPQFS